MTFSRWHVPSYWHDRRGRHHVEYGGRSRCPFARAGVGAILTQHRTDPQLGPQGLELLAAGQSAGQVIASLATR